MKTIGLVGIDTWHTNAYTGIFNGTVDAAPTIDRARITHVWPGNNPGKLAEAEAHAGKPYEHVVHDYADMIGAVDAVIVIDVDRGGKHHAEFARPFLEAGIPVFIDKPMTLTYRDAVELFDTAEATNTPVMSCSALRFPVELDHDVINGLGTLSTIVSVGPGEWFDYGIHAVESIGAVSDAHPVSVTHTALPKKDIVRVDYEGGLVGMVMTLRDASYQFHMSIYGADGYTQIAFDDAMGFYRNTMQAFATMIETREMPIRRDQTLAVLQILHAGNLSAEEDRTVHIEEITGGHS